MGKVVSSMGPVTLGRDAKVQFEDAKTQSGWVERYLKVGDKRAYEIGNGCGTCEFLFSRLEGSSSKVSVEELTGRLAAGIDDVRHEAVETFSTVLANGQYFVTLRDVNLRLVSPHDPHDYFNKEQIDLWGIDGFWGLPHYTRVPYYRAGEYNMGKGVGLFDFVVPMYPPNWLTDKTVETYLNQNESDTPTAVTLSVLDIKQPADWGDDSEINKHWCLTNFLLDGHHKVFAASRENRPIRLLSFIAQDGGVAFKENVAELVEFLKTVG